MKTYGQAAGLQRRLGVTSETATKIAMIVIIAGCIEYLLERAIWQLRGLDPKGLRPPTDGKSITDMIGLLEQSAQNMTDPDHRLFLTTWCEAARNAFVVRHNVVHGIPTKQGDMIGFFRNPRWHGESRKREFGSFYAGEYSLDMFVDALATLLRPMTELVNDRPLSEIVSPVAIGALHDARSIAGEYASRDYNPSFEKY